jgi:murein DD-endopeptidase MepM/ murein hydrolase activator NlpD
MAKDSYTLIIVPNASSGLHKLQIPLTVLYGICLLLLIGFFSVVGLGFSYAQMALKTVDYNQLRTENTTLKVENKNLEIATRQLNTKIEGLEQLSDRIQEMMLADTWNQRFGLVDNDGVGGSMEDYPTAAIIAGLTVRDNIDVARDRTLGLEDHFRFVEQIAEVRAGKLLSTPSMWPVNGPIRSAYGRRRDPFTGETELHRALDIGALYGTLVRAPADGRVIYSRRRADYGNLIVIDHGGGITTRFGHLSRFEAFAGDQVEKGEVIGYVGNSGRSTGPHLHYEVRMNDRPLNPTNYLPVATSLVAD